VTGSYVFSERQLVGEKQSTTDPVDDIPVGHVLELQRDRAARLMERQRVSIEARIHKLLGDGARRLVDTEDVVSTALRRIDSLILRGKFEEQSEAHFYGLVHGVIERTILEKAVAASRLAKRELLARQLFDACKIDSGRPETDSESEFTRIGALIRSPIDREIAMLRGRDIPFHVIAEMMDMDPAAVRKRWSRMRAQILHQVQEKNDK
jgi:DNA-directed RNA polymerase specialized sigma24 family protein